MRWNPFSKKSTSEPVQLEVGRPVNSYGKDPITEERAIELLFGGFGVPSAAGPVITEQTAMRISTFYRCVSLIAGTIASLPCEVYERKSGNQRELALDHPVFWLVHNEPNPKMTANTFWKNYLWSGCTRGNCYGLIDRNRNGVPVGIHWAPAQNVEPRDSTDYTRLWYSVRLKDGSVRVFDQDDVLHYPFIGFNGKEGRAPMECAKEALGLALSAEEFNASYFQGGNAADLALIYDGRVDAEQAQRILDTYERNRTGPKNMRLPLVLSAGKDAKRLDFNAEDTQLIEGRYFQVEDICRFFGVPPHLAGHTVKSTSWGTGIEEQTLGFVRFTLRDYIKGLEQEINRKLLRDPRYFVKFNLDSLLRADSRARAEYFKTALGGNQLPGFMTVNEVRALENLPPVSGGDQVYVPIDGNKENTDET